MTARSTKREVRQVVLERFDDDRQADEFALFAVMPGGIEDMSLAVPAADFRALGEPERITVTIEAGERTEALADVVSDMQMQRQLDNEPCPSCGGDRVRPDFVTTGRCHVPKEKP